MRGERRGEDLRVVVVHVLLVVHDVVDTEEEVRE